MLNVSIIKCLSDNYSYLLKDETTNNGVKTENDCNIDLQRKGFTSENFKIEVINKIFEIIYMSQKIIVP